MYKPFSYNDSAFLGGLIRQNIVATGGTITEVDVSGVIYKVHTFATSGTFDVLEGGDGLECFLVGGGGGGSGTDSVWPGGGGGAGGAITTNFTTSPIPISAGAYTITIGAGGGGGIHRAAI